MRKKWAKFSRFLGSYLEMDYVLMKNVNDRTVIESSVVLLLRSSIKRDAPQMCWFLDSKILQGRKYLKR